MIHSLVACNRVMNPSLKSSEIEPVKRGLSLRLLAEHHHVDVDLRASR